MNTNCKKVFPIILSVVNAFGTIATAVLTMKSTVKASVKIKKFKENKEESPTKLEILKVALPSFVSPIICGAITISSGIASTIISKKTEASLIATCTMLDQGYRKYKDKIKSTLGMEKHQEVLNSIMKDDYENAKPINNTNFKKLYWEEHVGFFLADPEKVAWAYGHLNKQVTASGYGLYGVYTLKQLFEDMGAEFLDKKLSQAYLNFGWSLDYMSECWEYVWVHMYTEDTLDENGNQMTKIWFDEEPIWNPENWYDMYSGHLHPATYLEGIPEDYNEKECSETD